MKRFFIITAHRTSNFVVKVGERKKIADAHRLRVENSKGMRKSSAENISNLLMKNCLNYTDCALICGGNLCK
jgi:hypothetical protein